MDSGMQRMRRSARAWPAWDRMLLGVGLLALSVGCIETKDDADGDGWLADADCDDSNSEVHPEADELCDGIDNNCDGTVDEEAAVDATEWFVDLDGDGFGDASKVAKLACVQLSGTAAVSGDCDDTRADRNPETVWFADLDGDQYGDASGERVVDCWPRAGFADNDRDCNDDSASVHPGATEQCNDIDDDCDGATDEDDHHTYYFDSDGDGFGTARSFEDGATFEACKPPEDFVDNALDCDDDNPEVHPAATRICGDGIDNTCDDILGRDIAVLHCEGELEHADVRILGSAEEEAFGGHLTTVRDVFGPGDDALVVGAEGFQVDADNVPGAAWVFQMSALMGTAGTSDWVEAATLGVRIEGLGSDDQMSSGLASAGDVDGDGIADLVLGADKFDTTGLSSEVLGGAAGDLNVGGVFVVPGSVLQDAEPGSTLAAVDYLWAYGVTRADWLGGSAAGGDLNGDGLADVVSGSTGLAYVDAATGTSYSTAGGFAVVFGQSGVTQPDPVAITDLAAEGRGLRLFGVAGQNLSVGETVAVGDLTGDGIADLVVGVVREDSDRGAVYLLEGPLEEEGSITDLASGHLLGADANGSFGSEVVYVAAQADCGDGYASILVAANSTSFGIPRQAGAVYQFDFGGDLDLEVGSAPTIAAGSVVGSIPDLRFGRGVSSNGFVDDSDCHPDLIVSTWQASDGDLRGNVRVFLGPLEGSVLDTDSRAVLAGEEPFARAGESATFAHAPSLDSGAVYPGVHDAIVVGADRFDRDSGGGAQRENAGAVHIFTSIGY